MMDSRKNRSYFFGIIQFVRITYHKWRSPFDVTNEWIDFIFKKHFNRESKSKYNPDLFENQLKDGNELLNNITISSNENLINEIRILIDWINEFEKYYPEMLSFLKRDKRKINTSSVQYAQFKYFLSIKKNLIKTTKKWKKSFENNDLKSINSLEGFNYSYTYKGELIRIVKDYRFEKLSFYAEDEKFISNPPHQDEWYPIEIVFRRLKEIVYQLGIITNQIKKYQNTNSTMIIGDAGMGKSNLSAYLSLSLIEHNYPIIFLRAKSFSGDPDKFEEIFLRELEIPSGYNLSEVLNKLNSYGKSHNKRITIVIDALNETTYQNHGFSTIWLDHLNDFINRLEQYPFIYFVATLRTSYVERIWPDSRIPYDTITLKGFSENVIISVVKKYFDTYNISYKELNKADIFYFRTPLLLYLYCEMLNPHKQSGISATLGLKGFQEVFEKYIENLSNEIKTDLALISVNQINDGFAKISSQMIEEIQAFVEILNYYELFEGKKIKTINHSIGHNVLEGYLIYVKDSINKKDVITHTQQEVGGYLLAKYLKEKHEDLSKIIASNFFQENIIGLPENKHQLADDIIKFLIIDEREALILFDFLPKNEVLNTFTLNLLQREFNSPVLNSLKNRFIEKNESPNGIIELFEVAKSRLFDVDSPINFLEIKDFLLNLKNHDFELLWTKYLYQNWAEIEDFLIDFEESIDEWKKENPLNRNNQLFIEILLFSLETTNRKQRDKATILLLEIAEYHFDFFIEKIESNSYLKRLYILERLSSIVYGVFLRKQNDLQFLQKYLTITAKFVFNNQFSSKPINPIWHYVVIDNYKHIIDLAISKNLISLTKSEHEKFSKYYFVNEKWIEVSGDRIAQFNKCGYSPHTIECPDPFRMDFVIYTVSRLIEDGNFVKKAETLANIYQRLIDFGYVSSTFDEILDKGTAEFYFGTTPFLVRNKVDRLGKKYSWNAFFEYAGYLLQQGQLSTIWSEYDEIDGKPVYQRLGDVLFEVSNCDQSKSMLSEKIYQGDLLDVKTENRNWVEIEKFDEFLSIQTKEFDGKDFTLLYGYIEYKPDANYDVRSYLLIDSFLVKKEEIFGKEEKIINKTFDWNNRSNIHCSGRLHNVYFGELYWADNIPNAQIEHQTIEISEEEEKDIVLSFQDFINGPYKLEENKPGDIVRRKVNKHVSFHVEPTIFDYLWESDVESGAQESLRDNVPSPNIGKYLNLKSDPVNFQILDENLEKATITINWEEESKNVQKMNFLRSDLLQKYLDDKDLVLLYQVKQFTHDITIPGVGHQVDFRGTRFFMPHIKQTV